MLSCQDCEKYLPVFLDQALDVKESLDVQEHLQNCPACTDLAAAERTLRQFVRERASEPSPQEAVKRRIVRQAIQQSTRPRWRERLRMFVRPWDFALGAATAMLLLVFAIRFLGLGASAEEDMTQRLVRETSIAYDTYTSQSMPLEVETANDQVIVEWFNRRMGYPMAVPCITDKATKLRGGRLCRLFDRKSAAFIYQRDGVDLVLFAFKGAGLALPSKRMMQTQNGTFYIQHVSGRPVAMWKRDGVTYSLIGDLDRDELLRVAGTIHYR
jgi:anti-sigma factor RsiW